MPHFRQFDYVRPSHVSAAVWSQVRLRPDTRESYREDYGSCVVQDV